MHLSNKNEFSYFVFIQHCSSDLILFCILFFYAALLM